MRSGLNVYIAVMAGFIVSCTGHQPNPWEDLNYSSVYRRAKLREIDAFYTPPADVGCMEGYSNLYNCH